jgi:hypothetical protein
MKEVLKIKISVTENALFAHGGPELFCIKVATNAS